MSVSFNCMATVEASTKRPPAITGGKGGAMVEHIPALRCTPLDPVTAEIAQRFALGTPLELLQTFTLDADVREGDVLVVDDREYPIKAVADWRWDRFTITRHLILEDLKN